MKGWEYICVTGLYLYKNCSIHENCFELKHNDDKFLNELKSMNLGICNIDLCDFLKRNLK